MPETPMTGAESQAVESHTVASVPPSAVKVVLYIAYLAGLFGVMLFLPAGRLDWVRGWIYIVLVIVFVTINWGCMHRWNPVLIGRRMRYGKGTKRWDFIWLAFSAPLAIGIYVVAGLEARQATLGLPITVWPLGLAIFAVGFFFSVWSMVVNPFFEKTVRIQSEQGHRVIETGPYAWVRHPGYVGFTGWILAAPLLLGSSWALIPAAFSIVALLIRTALEDRTLRAELPGYDQYAQRVRYRLIPGLW